MPADNPNTLGSRAQALARLAAALLALAAGALLVRAGVAAAANLSREASVPTRTDLAVRLPDWFGQWEIVGASPSATGGMEQSLEEVLRGMEQWGPPPYKPGMRAQFAQIAAQVQQESDAALAGAAIPGLRRICTFGYPSVMLESPLMFEILPTPKETAMIFSGREIRHIYTDGRQHTAKEDLWPTFWGDSIGHWEGQTLVIDTIAVSSPFVPEGTAFAAFGGDANDSRLIAIFSPGAHFVERFRMIDKDHLEDQMTIMDPVFFSAPWHISRTYSRVTRIHRMVHEDCEGEERNPIVNDRYTLAPPPSPPTPQPPATGPSAPATTPSSPR